jgi:alpha-D-xyloside xylohydrolase
VFGSIHKLPKKASYSRKLQERLPDEEETNGRPFQTDQWQAAMGLVDCTNPDAVKWYRDELNKMVDMGVDAFNTDFGEKIPAKDIVYHDGSDAALIHNYYTFLYNETVSDVLEKCRDKHDVPVC